MLTVAGRYEERYEHVNSKVPQCQSTVNCKQSKDCQHNMVANMSVNAQKRTRNIIRRIKLFELK